MLLKIGEVRKSGELHKIKRLNLQKAFTERKRATGVTCPEAQLNPRSEAEGAVGIRTGIENHLSYEFH
jgi:hypothetical protein